MINQSNETTGEECEWSPPFDDYILAIFGVLYSLVIIAATVGNALVVYVVLTNRKMQSVTNTFIANLAASDLLVVLSSGWVTPAYALMGRWAFGEMMCYLLPLITGAGMFISTITFTSIAI